MTPSEQIKAFLAAKSASSRAGARVPAREEQEPPSENSSESIPSVPDAELTPGQLAEARRIAADLKRLRRDGAIKSIEDASFYAHFIKMFGAAYAGKQPKDDAAEPNPLRLTEEQRVRVPPELTPEERKRRWLKKDLDAAFGE